ncbi:MULTISPECIES: fibronectin type III domain-containing protein [unclassified Blastococcus]
MAATATSGLIGIVGTASAATPRGPGNIEVFPDRDMVAIEGYTAQAGQTATLTVTRGGQVMGTATGVVPADGFIEWNHDAASCFTDLTPDIVAGDKVSVSFSGSTLVDDMTVSSAVITERTASVPSTGNTNSVTVRGTYGGDVNLDHFAVEVVNPAMRDAGAIGERAISWSPNEAPDPAATGYTVSGSAADGRFEVTFSNMSQEDQQMVFDGQWVALGWMAEPTTGIEQQLGLTLAEYGLASGGAPGCPAGPAGAEPPASEFSVVWNSDTQATVTWKAAAPVAGGSAVTGYNIEALEPADTAGARELRGVRVGQNATQAVLTGLDPAALYDIEVRSMVGGELGAPFALLGTSAVPGDTPGAVGPTLTTTPAFNGDTAVIAESRTLTLTPETGSTAYYTLDGTPVTTEPNGRVPATNATLYTEPIPITADNTRVNVVAINAAGGATHATGVVSPKPAAAAVAPTGVAVLGSTGAGPANNAGTINVGWNPVPDATSYRIRVFDQTIGSSTAPVLQSQYDTVVTGATNGTVTGLPKSQPNHRYVVRVQARTPVTPVNQWGPISTGNLANAIVTGDDIAVEVAIYRAGDELRIRGAGTVPGSTITAHRTNTAGTGPVATPVAGYPTGVVGPLDAGLPTGTWEIVVDPAPATNPGTLWFKSSNGDVIGPITVENR